MKVNLDVPDSMALNVRAVQFESDKCDIRGVGDQSGSSQ